MKKTRLFQFASLVVLATGCSQEEILTDNNATKETVISAVMESAETRSYATDEGKFTWSDGDRISVITSKGGLKEFTLEGRGGTAEANFMGSISLGENITYAVYPFSDSHWVSGRNSVEFYMPAEYGDFSTNYVANTNAPMYAAMDGTGIINFKHLAGVLRVSVDNVPKNAAQFVFTAADKDITGYCSLDLGESNPVIESKPLSTNNTVTINFKPRGKAEDNMIFFVPLPVGTYNGFNIAINDEEGTTLAEYTHEKSNTMKQKTLARFSVTFDKVVEAVVHEDVALTEAGTLASVLGEKIKTVTSLNVTGPLNGSDINCLRQMMNCLAGRNPDTPYENTGVLRDLDLSEASIVEGGDAYFLENPGEEWQGEWRTQADNLNNFMFYASQTLENIKLPNNLTGFSGEAVFEHSPALTSVTIPAGISSIGSWNFNDCESLSTVYCYATTPPEFGSDNFRVRGEKMTLYVPKGCKEVYETSTNYGSWMNDCWSDYFTIVEME